MNLVLDKHKFLAIIYLILAFCWVAFVIFPEVFQFPQLDRTLFILFIGMLGVLFVLFFSLMHWRVSNTAQGLPGEKLFVFFSFLNIISFVFEIWLFNCTGESCVGFLYAVPFIFSASILTILSGTPLVFKINKKALLWVFFTPVLVILILYFITWFV